MTLAEFNGFYEIRRYKMIFEKQIIEMYKGMAYTRCDDNGTAYYFSADDFSGLNREAYRFKSSMGHDLSGYIYSYESPKSGKLVVFDHGFGGGHRSYMKEIEKLCAHGFTVFAYDHTGCMESGGENPNGMAQSLCDLNDALTAIKSDARFAGVELYVMGHSWGGFSTLNISALHPEVSRIVVLSGFVSVPMLVGSYFGGIMKPYRKPIMELEKAANPRFVACNAVESLSGSKAKALLIYSDNDKMCRKKPHYDALAAGLEGKENIKLVLVEGKGHNPNYTKDAVKYLGEYLAAKAKLAKKKQLETAQQKADFVAGYDWWAMTMQDMDVWNRIFEFIE